MDEDAERQKLLEIKAVYENAVKENKMELLKPHLDDEFSFVTLTKREFTDFDSFIKQWNITREQLLKGGTYEVVLDPDKSRFIGNVAITKGRSESTLVTGNGRKFQFAENWTAVCVKKDDVWKVARIHSSIDPFKNPFIVAQVKSLLFKIAVVSVAVGVSLGYLISFVK